LGRGCMRAFSMCHRTQTPHMYFFHHRLVSTVNKDVQSIDFGDIFSRTASEFNKKEIEEKQKILLEDKTKTPKVASVIFNRRNLNCGMKKLGRLVKQIRGLSCNEASIQLKFSTMRIASSVKKFIDYASYKANKTHLLDQDRLIISELFVTKGVYPPPKPDFRAKGRVGLRTQRTSHLRLKVSEVPYVEGKTYVGKFARGINKIKWQSYKYQKKMAKFKKLLLQNIPETKQ